LLDAAVCALTVVMTGRCPDKQAMTTDDIVPNG
jgi:hypothetical protein